MFFKIPFCLNKNKALNFYCTVFLKKEQFLTVKIKINQQHTIDYAQSCFFKYFNFLSLEQLYLLLMKLDIEIKYK